MLLQVIMTQLCTAVYITPPPPMCWELLPLSAVIQRFAQDESDYSSSPSMLLVNSRQQCQQMVTFQWACVQVMQIYWQSVFAWKYFLFFPQYLKLWIYSIVCLVKTWSLLAATLSSRGWSDFSALDLIILSIVFISFTDWTHASV